MEHITAANSFQTRMNLILRAVWNDDFHFYSYFQKKRMRKFSGS
jgi:hypothetical protein